MPMVIKDNLDTSGVRTTAGSLFFKDHIPYGQNIGTAEAPVLHRAIELPERRVGATGSKAASATSSISQSHRAQSEFRDRTFGCAITPPLDGNSAGAHPIAPGIEQAAARGGYPYHEGIAGHYPCPADPARHANAQRIRSAPAAGSARPTGLPWTSTPPSPTEPSAPRRHSSSDSGQAARSVRPDLTQ